MTEDMVVLSACVIGCVGKRLCLEDAYDLENAGILVRVSVKGEAISS